MKHSFRRLHGLLLGLVFLVVPSGCASFDQKEQSHDAIEAAYKQPVEPHRGIDNPGYVNPHGSPDELP